MVGVRLQIAASTRAASFHTEFEKQRVGQVTFKPLHRIFIYKPAEMTRVRALHVLQLGD